MPASRTQCKEKGQKKKEYKKVVTEAGSMKNSHRHKYIRRRR